MTSGSTLASTIFKMSATPEEYLASGAAGWGWVSG
jgi:hypothetical protein